MANTFFKFKQFTVHQDLCAMKVCTDACVQGAYTGRYFKDNQLTAPAILDIGAGTGLLSLMLAQQTASAITAVELDAQAALQAKQNFNASPWAGRLQLIQTDIRTWSVNPPFDFIITNPPFYESALRSGHAQKDQAMHATNLGYADLLKAIDRLLSASGEVSVLLPYPSFTGFEALAIKQGFYLKQVLHVRQSVNHGYFRTVGIFSRQPAETHITELIIRDAANNYTAEFIELLKPYYLIF